MGDSSGIVEIDKIEIEPIQQFYEWLQGSDSPKTITLNARPELTAQEAFSVIYYLQEELGILSDCYEKCRKCLCLYDSFSEGVSIDKDSTIINQDRKEVDGDFSEELYGCYCENCRPD